MPADEMETFQMLSDRYEPDVQVSVEATVAEEQLTVSRDL